MKFLILSIVLLSVCLCQAKSSLKLKKRVKYCHWNQALFCVNDLRAFTAIVNGTGMPTSEHEFDQLCGFYIYHFTSCIRKWMKRCGTSLHQEVLEKLLIEPLKDSANDFCDPKNMYRARFLKHSPCLKNVKLTESYRKKCVQPLQAGFEYIMKYEDIKTAFAGTCCAYNRWESCIKGFLNDFCGPESPPIIVDLVHAAAMQLLDQVCPPSYFDPKSKLCTDILPPLHTKAKGAKSDSFFSYLFSWACPNVGYGIVD